MGLHTHLLLLALAPHRATTHTSLKPALSPNSPHTAHTADDVHDLHDHQNYARSALSPVALSAAAYALALPAAPALALDGGVSKASFYTTLALYVLSFPGIFSLVTRSAKSKCVQKTYEVPGPAAAAGARPTRELAADVLAFFQANNYKIKDDPDRSVIVFEGVQAPLAGRAAFLTTCVFVALGSLSLVLTIFEQSVFGEGGGLGNLWYLSTLASPVAGKYYLDNAERTEEIRVKIVTDDDELMNDLTIQGDEEEVERFQRTLDLREKGMVYVKGILADS